MARNDYGPLREAHQAALDAATSQQREQTLAAEATEIGPTRPEAHYGQSPGWTSEGGMEQQQAAANRWAKASQEHERRSLGRQHTQEDREQHIERTQVDESPAQAREIVQQELSQRETGAANEARAMENEAASAEISDAKAERLSKVDSMLREANERGNALEAGRTLDRGGRDGR